MIKKSTSGLRTWIEIDKKRIAHNYRILRSILTKNAMFGAVVKSNAYGHGFLNFVDEIVKLGIDWLIVDSITEALTLRQNYKQKPILVLGYTLPEKMREALDNNISLTISSLKSLNDVLKAAKKLRKEINIHIKVDTGLARQGFLLKDLKQVIKLLNENKKSLKTEGLYTHFSTVTGRKLKYRVANQLQIFDEWIGAFKKAGLKPIIHSANSGAMMLFSETHFDMVRVGISIYGLWPSIEIEKVMKKKIKLKPILSWKTIVSDVKPYSKGTPVGYDGTEVLQRNSLLAVCPVGYWHGYSRKLSRTSYVLVRGKRAKIIGAVSMNIIIIDVTDIHGVKEGDKVVLLGKQGGEEITPQELATIEGTSQYETITRLNPLIKRLYI